MSHEIFRVALGQAITSADDAQCAVMLAPVRGRATVGYSCPIIKPANLKNIHIFAISVRV